MSLTGLRKNLILVSACILCLKARAGDYQPNRNGIYYSVYSSDIEKSIRTLKKFFDDNGLHLTSYSQNSQKYNYHFRLPKNKTSQLDSLINTLGFRASKTIKSNNGQEQNMEQLQLALEQLKNKKEAYGKLLAKLDSVNGKTYLLYYEKIIEIQDQISKKEADIKQIQENESIEIVEIDLFDDYATPDSKINFVHMPGGEFNLLFVENPLSGTSSPLYQGYSLKYLFTKGKSYFSIGAYKPVNDLEKKDTSNIKDIFNLTFGQDFYNRHLGRGKLKMFNLYIGYQVGVSNARSLSADRIFANVAPVMGLELFKNKYFILDVSGSYFIPLNQFTYTLRGVKLNASLNFSF